ncbi:hypothetical protein [Negadavirga shengliensis]|uniref:PepSY domain-containing protein n=1 Tax=Negadavirga shengliensis TaxID=1389218 RepID=A0ABV9T648_9BACT
MATINSKGIMKKIMLALIMAGFVTVATAPTQAMSETGVETIFQEKTNIDPENLPERVKEAIQNDAAVSSSPITEAQQVTKDNQVYYVVKFGKDAEGNDVKKKFDATGKEIEDTGDEES